MLIGFPDREFQAKVDSKLPFLEKNREIGKNRENFEKIDRDISFLSNDRYIVVELI